MNHYRGIPLSFLAAAPWELSHLTFIFAGADHSLMPADESMRVLCGTKHPLLMEDFLQTESMSEDNTSQNLLNFLLHLYISSTCGCRGNFQRIVFLRAWLALWVYGRVNSSVLTNYSSSVLLYLSHRSWDSLKFKGLMLPGGTVPRRE